MIVGEGQRLVLRRVGDERAQFAIMVGDAMSQYNKLVYEGEAKLNQRIGITKVTPFKLELEPGEWELSAVETSLYRIQVGYPSGPQFDVARLQPFVPVRFSIEKGQSTYLGRVAFVLGLRDYTGAEGRVAKDLEMNPPVPYSRVTARRVSFQNEMSRDAELLGIPMGDSMRDLVPQLLAANPVLFVSGLRPEEIDHQGRIIRP